ncbi:3'-5' exonuclease, partial [Klebsiella pneumoniae]|uniref:3'-5' exonuclease n=1 Tax=Klebsiella pneumoniae TaxID=573 RepID=UPI00222F918B
ASSLHGICDEDVETALRFEQFAEPLLSFIGDSTIVVRDAAFDLLFLDDELERCGLPAINRDRVRDMKAIFWT